MGNDAERLEGLVPEGLGLVTADALGRHTQVLQTGDHFHRKAVAHQVSDGQSQLRQDLSMAVNGEPALYRDESVYGHCYFVTIVTNDDDIVDIMPRGRGDGRIAESETLYKDPTEISFSAVAVPDNDFKDTIVWIGMADCHNKAGPWSDGWWSHHLVPGR